MNAPQPTDTLLARRLGRVVELLRAARTVEVIDLAVGIAVLGVLAGLLLGAIKGIILGLPVAAAALARNICPEPGTRVAATRMGRVVEIIEDAMFFGIGAMIVFLPPLFAGWAVQRTIAAAFWGE